MSEGRLLRKYIILIKFGYDNISDGYSEAPGSHYVVKRDLEEMMSGINDLTATHIFTSRAYDTMAYIIHAPYDARTLRESLLGPNDQRRLKRNPNAELPDFIDGDDSFIIMELGNDGASSNFSARHCEDPLALLKMRI